jgi:ribosomal-protein-serine acetyltransferase
MFKYDLGNGAELRLLQPYLASELYEFVEANRAYLSPWLLWVNRLHTVSDAENFLREGLQEFARGAVLPTLGIWQAGHLAGGIAFYPLDEPRRSTELAYWLGKEFSGRGLMTRAVSAVLAYLFETLRLNRVQVRAELENTRSRALAERLGFTFEGIEQGGWTHGDELVDLAVYAMLASDWKIKLVHV